MIPIAPIVMFVIHASGVLSVPFYDMAACEKAKIELKKTDKTLTVKCLWTQTTKPDI
jgi:hypothetical protein